MPVLRISRATQDQTADSEACQSTLIIELRRFVVTECECAIRELDGELGLPKPYQVCGATRLRLGKGRYHEVISGFILQPVVLIAS
jgi:hypothetical protein